MHDSAPLLVEDLDGVRTITWNRAEALNAMTIEMWNGTRDALDSAEGDGVGCIVLAGTGRAFTVGQDLGEFADPRHADPSQGFRGTMRALEECQVPMVGAVDGLAVGFGLTVLAWCDVVVVSSAARFRAPFVGLGVTTEAAASVALPRILGDQLASWHLLSGDWLDAETAVRAGLALRLVDDPLATASEMAASLASQPPNALRETLGLVRGARRAGWSEALDAEYEVMGRLAGGEENLAAISAFFER
jgi:enoyl-CoA hydratase/carnithine racemase